MLERAGGYDASFVRAQDWELNHRIRGAGGTVWFTPDLRVTYRPRPTVRALARQYRDYGRWRRVVMRRHPDSVRVTYLVPPAATAAVLAGGALALDRPPPRPGAAGRLRRGRRRRVASSPGAGLPARGAAAAAARLRDDAPLRGAGASSPARATWGATGADRYGAVRPRARPARRQEASASALSRGSVCSMLRVFMAGTPASSSARGDSARDQSNVSVTRVPPRTGSRS